MKYIFFGFHFSNLSYVSQTTLLTLLTIVGYFVTSVLFCLHPQWN